jgi:phospholipase/carboxylesterase
MTNQIEINPNNPAKATIIWLHGLGASGDDFVPIVPELHLPENLNIRFIFPHAPKRPVTINFNYVMPAWYDIYDLNREAKEDEAGIDASCNTIAQLIDQEKNRAVASDKIILAGFSQGGAIALRTALHYPDKLAGVLALSTYLPLAKKTGGNLSHANKDLPIFMAHGTHDDIVPLQFAEMSKNFLEQHGYQVDWQTYPMAHQVCAAEIKAISERIQKWL